MSDTRSGYKNQAADQDPSILLGVTPTEVRKGNMYPRFSIAALGVFAQTSQQAESETASWRVFQAAIHALPQFRFDDKGNATDLAAIAILKRHPEFLKRKKQIQDHYGRAILGTPYQLFLGAGDVWAIKQVHEVILPSIKDDKERAELGVELEAQFKEQFPHCLWPLPEDFSEEMLYDERNKQQIKAIEEQLLTVKQCIEADKRCLRAGKQPSEATKQVIEALCKLFQPKAGEVIKAGLHFPLAIIKKINETYATLREGKLLFSFKVIKPALDALSTVDGQCCQFGLSVFDPVKGPRRRCHPSYQHPLGKPLSLTLANEEKKRVAALVDPYDGDVHFISSSLPGFSACFNKEGCWYRSRSWSFCEAFEPPRLGWTTYGEQKQWLMEAIMRPRHTEKPTHRRDEHHHQRKRCVIV